MASFSQTWLLSLVQESGNTDKGTKAKETEGRGGGGGGEERKNRVLNVTLVEAEGDAVKRLELCGL